MEEDHNREIEVCGQGKAREVEPQEPPTSHPRPFFDAPPGSARREESSSHFARQPSDRGRQGQIFHVTFFAGMSQPNDDMWQFEVILTMLGWNVLIWVFFF